MPKINRHTKKPNAPRGRTTPRDEDFVFTAGPNKGEIVPKDDIIDSGNLGGIRYSAFDSSGEEQKVVRYKSYKRANTKTPRLNRDGERHITDDTFVYGSGPNAGKPVPDEMYADIQDNGHTGCHIRRWIEDENGKHDVLFWKTYKNRKPRNAPKIQRHRDEEGSLTKHWNAGETNELQALTAESEFNERMPNIELQNRAHMDLQNDFIPHQPTETFYLQNNAGLFFSSPKNEPRLPVIAQALSDPNDSAIFSDEYFNNVEIDHELVGYLFGNLRK